MTETDYEVSFEIKNISQVDAKEVAQVYVRDVLAMVERPYKELKGFVKVALNAGESKRLASPLIALAIAWYSLHSVLDWNISQSPKATLSVQKHTKALSLTCSSWLVGSSGI